MKRLTATLCLTIAVLLGGVWWYEPPDFTKGYRAYNGGDYATALRNFRPLAERGDAGAQYYLALMYSLGKGVKEDRVYAHMWGSLAFSNGSGNNAKKLRDLDAELMTPSQIEKAERLARECVRKKYKDC